MIPGTWYIENYQIPHVISVSYGQDKIDLVCGAFKVNDNDPREIIDEILTYLSFPATRTINLSGGATIGSLFSNEPLNFSDGYDVFQGFVSAPKFIEDSFSNDYIEYKITILLYKEPVGDIGLSTIEDGDEITYDDDWEEGYESYTPPVEPAETKTPTVSKTIKKPVTKTTQKKYILRKSVF